MQRPSFGMYTQLTRVLLQHVSATFRKGSTNNDAEPDQSAKQIVLFKPEETAPAPTKNASKDTKLSLGGGPELTGLSIINQGQLTLHYHSYNAAPPSVPQQATMPLKRALDQTEDEQYSEALSSLVDFNLSPQLRPNPRASSKRPRVEEPEQPEQPEQPDEPDEPEIEPVEAEPHHSPRSIKQEEEESARQSKRRNKKCRNCGAAFRNRQNKGSKEPCIYHPGMLTTASPLILHLSKSRRRKWKKHLADS